MGPFAALERFFERLRTMGLNFTAHPFSDHHDFCAADLAYVGDAILATEKDAKPALEGDWMKEKKK